MRPFAAIDVGSNAIRLVLAKLVRQDQLQTLVKLREPVRLGADVFESGHVSPQTLEKFIQAFLTFKKTMQSHDAILLRAVATSALREAQNRSFIIDEVMRKTGIQIEVIDGTKEGALVHLAISHTLDLEKSTCAALDIGGGSVELSFSRFGQLLDSKSFPLGTVRMLQLMKKQNVKEKELFHLLRRELGPLLQFIKQKRPVDPIEFLVGTGGNLESMGKLRQQLLNKNSILKMSQGELQQILIQVLSMSYEERIHVLKLRPDRADVIVPALILTQEVCEALKTEKIRIPNVGVKEGILLSAMEKSHIDARISPRNLVTLARQ